MLVMTVFLALAAMVQVDSMSLSPAMLLYVVLSSYL